MVSRFAGYLHKHPPSPQTFLIFIQASRRRTSLHRSTPTQRPRSLRSRASNNPPRRFELLQRFQILPRRIHVLWPHRSRLRLRFLRPWYHQNIRLQSDRDPITLRTTMGRLLRLRTHSRVFLRSAQTSFPVHPLTDRDGHRRLRNPHHNSQKHPPRIRGSFPHHHGHILRPPRDGLLVQSQSRRSSSSGRGHGVADRVW